MLQTFLFPVEPHNFGKRLPLQLSRRRDFQCQFLLAAGEITIGVFRWVLHVSCLLFANVISILQNETGRVLLLGRPTSEREVSGRSLVAVMCNRNGAVPVLPRVLYLVG